MQITERHYTYYPSACKFFAQYHLLYVLSILKIELRNIHMMNGKARTLANVPTLLHYPQRRD